MKSLHDHKFHLASLVGDVHGLVKALDHIVDRDDRPGMQAVLNCLLERTAALEEAIDGPWPKAVAA